MSAPRGSLAVDFERDVLAVLVLFGRTLEESVTFQSLGEGLRRAGGRLELFVYDNSAVAGPIVEPPEWSIEYRHDPSNPGVSQAYIEGARRAEALGKRWLLLLDQDTFFPPAALDAYLEAMRRSPAAELFAPVLRSGDRVVSPCGYRFPLGTSLARIEPGVQPLQGKSVLNSGMCVSLAAYQEVGGHDPRIGLDFSDHEFIERFKRRYSSVCVVPVECRHGFSGDQSTEVTNGVVRFQVYCHGVRYASRGRMQRLWGAGLVAARACLLAARWQHLGFLRVAARSLFGSAR
jgi:rhamnosyltransferase